MIIYIYGPDTFRSRHYLKDQVKKFKEARDPEGYNVAILDAVKDGPGRIFSEMVSVPFLAEKRMIVVENILSVKDKDFVTNFLEMVRGKKLPESNVIVLWQGDAKSKIKEVEELEKFLTSQEYAKEFGELNGAQLRAWASGEFKNRGCSINAQALEFLLANVLGDVWALNSLIDQLSSYAGKKEVSISDVEKFVEEKVDDNIFNMVEAVVSGNKKQAYKLLEEQRRLGEEEGKLFGLLSWQFRILIMMRSIFDAEDGINSADMAKRLGLHPFVVKKNLALLKRFNISKLKEIYKELLEIDSKIKVGLGDRSMYIDLLVARL